VLEVDTPSHLAALVGKPLGTSEWVTVDQAMIDTFAEATGDHQWIHVDVERAKREMPGGKTIAHGYLTLSLLPRLGDSTYRIRNMSRAINYGTNKMRFASSRARRIAGAPASGPEGRGGREGRRPHDVRLHGGTRRQRQAGPGSRGAVHGVRLTRLV
jgi:MaoC dehydratase-like protein